MAAQMAREWTGIQQFPAATQNKLFELLGKLKQENVDSLTILVLGKGGVGKSSTVNSVIGERVVAVSAFQSEGPRPVMVSRSRAGFTLNIIDTPGLVEGGYVNDRALHMIKSFLRNKTIDILLYVDRLDAYRVDTLDRQIIKAITDGFGKGIWDRTAIVLSHAQLSSPDGLSYKDFVSKRSEALLKVVRLGARIRKQDTCASSMPVVLVENSGRCSKNDDGEKVLPDGVSWIPNLVKVIIDIVSNGSTGILVDERLIEGPNPNDRWKFLIPLIVVGQVSDEHISHLLHQTLWLHLDALFCTFAPIFRMGKEETVRFALPLLGTPSNFLSPLARASCFTLFVLPFWSFFEVFRLCYNFLYFVLPRTLSFSLEFNIPFIRK